MMINNNFTTCFWIQKIIYSIILNKIVKQILSKGLPNKIYYSVDLLSNQ